MIDISKLLSLFKRSTQSPVASGSGSFLLFKLSLLQSNISNEDNFQQEAGLRLHIMNTDGISSAIHHLFHVDSLNTI
jgi:hypothetical protein